VPLLDTPEGETTEWESQALRAYQRRTLAADALIASVYLSGAKGDGEQTG
jgi:putative transposase